MKLFNKFLAAGAALALGLAACEKVPELPFYADGKAPVLSSSVASLAPAPGDSNKFVLSFTWTDPQYSTNPATNKYILQLDSAGRNFSKAISREVIGERSYSFLGKDLNAALLAFGLEFGKPYNIEARVISSYGNNNERYTSAPITISYTPYKVPPRVPLPSTGRLFIVGDATEGDWSNPVPVPTQELTRIDETTFGGIFYLNGGGSYLIIPENGQWRKYSVADGSLPNLWQGGEFGQELSSNFPGPLVDGWYRIILDFQRGRFSVTPFTQQHGLPQNLVIVGGATPGGWANEPNNPQRFTRRNSTRWDITINLTAGQEYLILPEPGNWGKKYGVDDNGIEAAKMAGVLKPEGQNIKAPNTTGNYKIVVDFINNSYVLTRQ
jgi:hypothetical protein